jgi:catechol-2,3-dioxygenase
VTRQVDGIAEIVLWVRDMNVALDFYERLLGLEVISPAATPIKFLKAAEGELGVPDMIVLVMAPHSRAPRRSGSCTTSRSACRPAPMTRSARASNGSRSR